MKRYALALLLLPLAAAAAPPSRPAVAACGQEVQRSGKSIAEAGPDCSALLAAIRAGSDGIPGDPGLAQALGELGAEALGDYAATLPPETTAGTRAAIDPAAVDGILAGLPDPNARPRTLWERIDAWLRRLLAPAQSREAEPPQWLMRLLEGLGHIPAVLVKALVWLLFGMLLLSLVWVVVRELRAAGFNLRWRQPVRASRLPAGEAPPVALVEGLPERERPAALLRWVIARLIERGLLPANTALTNGELQALLPAPVRPPFGALRRHAERAYFGGARLAAADLDQALELAQLLTRQPAAGAAR